VVVVPSVDTVVLTTVGSTEDTEGGGGGTSAAAATPEKATRARPDMTNSRTNFIGFLL
jgi:hypothetical protein